MKRGTGWEGETEAAEEEGSGGVVAAGATDGAVDEGGRGEMSSVGLAGCADGASSTATFAPATSSPVSFSRKSSSSAPHNIPAASTSSTGDGGGALKNGSFRLLREILNPLASSAACDGSAANTRRRSAGPQPGGRVARSAAAEGRRAAGMYESGLEKRGRVRFGRRERERRDLVRSEGRDDGGEEDARGGDEGGVDKEEADLTTSGKSSSLNTHSVTGAAGAGIQCPCGETLNDRIGEVEGARSGSDLAVFEMDDLRERGDVVSEAGVEGVKNDTSRSSRSPSSSSSSDSNSLVRTVDIDDGARLATSETDSLLEVIALVASSAPGSLSVLDLLLGAAASLDARRPAGRPGSPPSPTMTSSPISASVQQHAQHSSAAGSGSLYLRLESERGGSGGRFAVWGVAERDERTRSGERRPLLAGGSDRASVSPSTPLVFSEPILPRRRDERRWWSAVCPR